MMDHAWSTQCRIWQGFSNFQQPETPSSENKKSMDPCMMTFQMNIMNITQLLKETH